MTLDGIPIIDIGAGALLAFGILAILTGRLIPRRTHDETRHDAEMWRAAHMISEQARAKGESQVEELLEHARTTDAFIRALPRPRGSDR